MFEGGGGNDQVRIVSGLPRPAPSYPQVRRALQNGVGDAKDEGVLAEHCELPELAGSPFILEASNDFIARYRGEGELLVVLEIADGTLHDSWVPLLENLGEGVRVEEAECHGRFTQKGG